MSKYKVGDVVIVVRPLTNKQFVDGIWGEHLVGKIFKVDRMLSFPSDDYRTMAYYPEDGTQGAFEPMLELEAVYNSPLYKALE